MATFFCHWSIELRTWQTVILTTAQTNSFVMSSGVAGLSREDRDFLVCRTHDNRSSLEVHAGTETLHLTDIESGSTGATSGSAEMKVTSTTGPLIVGGLDEFEATIVVVVIEDDEESLKPATEAITHNLVNSDKALVAEVGRKGCDGLDEVEGARTSIAGSWWKGHENGAGIIAMNLVHASNIGLLVSGPELMQNGDSNLGLESDLVPETKALESWRKCHWSDMAEESGKSLTDRFGGVEGVHTDIVESRACVAQLEGIGHVQHLEVKPGASGAKHQADAVGHLLLDSGRPLFV